MQSCGLGTGLNEGSFTNIRAILSVKFLTQNDPATNPIF